MVANEAGPTSSAGFGTFSPCRMAKAKICLTMSRTWTAVAGAPWFSGHEGPPALFAGRILAFDERAALIWARLMAEGRTTGRPRSALDTIIAATSVTNSCVVVTGNERDFGGMEVVNPMGGGEVQLAANYREGRHMRPHPEKPTPPA